MAGGVELATAYVNIVPSMQGAQGQITEMITGEAATAGTDAGQQMGDNMGEGLNLAMVAKAAAIATTVAGIAREAWATFNEVAEYGDNIDKQSQMLMISADAYQTLNFAAERSGASINTFSRGIRTMTNDLADAQNGIAGATDNWDRLGVSVFGANGELRTIEEVMFDSLYALADMEDVTQRNAIANDIFGRSYVELIPLLNQGSEGIEALMGEARDLGGVMSQDGVNASAEFHDAMYNLNFAIQGVKNGLAESGLLGAFADWVNAAASWVGGDHPILERAFESLTGDTGALTVAFEAASSALGVIGETGSAVYETLNPLWEDLLEGWNSVVDQMNEDIPGLGTGLSNLASEITNPFEMLAGTFERLIGVIQLLRGEYDSASSLLGTNLQAPQGPGVLNLRSSPTGRSSTIAWR